LLALHLFLVSDVARERAPAFLWVATYALSFVVLARRLLRGELLDPAVCLVGTYLALLGLGSLLHASLRSSTLSPWVQNAIGAGHAALWAGCVLGSTLPAPPARAPQGIASREGAQLLLVLLLACAGATVALFVTFGEVPLLAADPDMARLAILAGRGELGIFLVGLGVLTYAFLHDALARGASPRCAHFAMLATLAVLVSLGGRARALAFVLGYAGLFLRHRPRRLRPVALLLGALAALAFLAGVGAWRRGGSVRAEDALAELGIGALALPSMVARLEQRVEPGALPSGPWSDLGTLLPGEDHGLNVELKYAVFENWRALPPSAGVNPSLVGEGYLFFGVAGVVWEPFLLGLASAFLWKRAGARPRSVGTLLYVCWITGMMAAISAGLGIRLTHFAQQLVWIALAGPFFLVRARSAVGSKTPDRPASLGRLA
jgi:hypothetical protein